MSRGTLFWIVYCLALILGLWIHWPTGQNAGFVHFAPLGGSLIVFVLIGLLGWKCYGPAITD